MILIIHQTALFSVIFSPARNDSEIEHLLFLRFFFGKLIVFASNPGFRILFVQVFFIRAGGGHLVVFIGYLLGGLVFPFAHVLYCAAYFFKTLCFIYEGIQRPSQGPSPSQDRVLFFAKKEHKPPKPVVVGSKPTGPAISICYKLQYLPLDDDLLSVGANAMKRSRRSDEQIIQLL